MNRVRRLSAARLLWVVMLFELAACGLLSLRDGAFDPMALLFGAALIAVLLLQYGVMQWLSPHADRFLLVIANFLSAVGAIIQYRLSCETAFKQLIWLLMGTAAMVACALLMRRQGMFRRLSWPLMLMSLGVLAVLLVIGEESGGAKNWISLGGISVQPSEFVKVALVFVMANHFEAAERTRDWLPSAIFAILCAMLLVAERDLGAALLICVAYLIVFYAATGRLGVTLVGLGSGCLGAAASYLLFDHVKARVAAWLNPWASYTTSGYQIAQGLMAIATGGLLGRGLTMGSPKSIPAYNTDYIFAVICEEFGIIFGIGIIALYLVFIIRGSLTALNARNRYLMLVAFGCTVLITLQSFIIIGGVIKLIPLTGITLPFVSYGGSSMVASMMLLGILEGVSIQNGEMLEEAITEAGGEGTI